MGKRQIGEMEPSEFVVSILIADLASIPMQDIGIPLLSGLIPIGCVLALELLLSFGAMRSIRLRKLFCGSPVILIENGVIQQERLRKTRITIDELTEHLRQNQILDLSTVKFAILETNGQLSTFLDARYQPPSAMDCGICVDETQLPCTLISDGKILEENLAASGRSHSWLEKELKKLHCSVAETFYFTVTPNGRVFHCRKQKEAP